MALDILYILIGAAIHFGIGFAWYGKLFERQWAEAYGFLPEEMHPTPMHFAQAGVVAVLISMGFCYLTSGFGAISIGQGISLGFFTWLFVVAPTQYASVIWNKRPLQGYLIDVGCYLASFVALGAFFGLVH